MNQNFDKTKIFKSLTQINNRYHHELVKEGKELLTLFGANQISFDISFNSGRTLILNSNPQLLDFYVESNGLLHDPMAKAPELIKSQFCSWESYQKKDYSPVLEGFSKYFNLDQGTSFSRIKPDGYAVGIAIGASKKDPKFLQRVVENISLIDSFIDHLDKKFTAKLSKETGIILPNYKPDYYVDDQSPYDLIEQRIKILQVMGKVSDEDAELFCNVKLTARQMQCSSLLLQGLSMSKVGAYLDISKQSVVEHIDAVKRKFKISKQEQLLEKLESMKLLGLLTNYEYHR